VGAVSLYQRFMARGEYPYREVAAPPPDLLHESELRGATAAIVARSELGPGVAHVGWELTATLALPDPYGPDPVVFGSVPRVAAG
jgi:hypothetical protein